MSSRMITAILIAFVLSLGTGFAVAQEEDWSWVGKDPKSDQRWNDLFARLLIQSGQELRDLQADLNKYKARGPYGTFANVLYYTHKATAATRMFNEFIRVGGSVPSTLKLWADKWANETYPTLLELDIILGDAIANSEQRYKETIARYERRIRELEEDYEREAERYEKFRSHFVRATKPHVFESPRWHGIRVDNCLKWAHQCGWAAAHEYCRRRGYKKGAEHFTYSAPLKETITIKDNNVCRPNHYFPTRVPQRVPRCIGFDVIHCKK